MREARLHFWTFSFSEPMAKLTKCCLSPTTLLSNFDRNPALSFNTLDGRATLLRGDCSQHVIRGGGWDSTALQARLAARAVLDSGAEANTVGFRVARTFE